MSGVIDIAEFRARRAPRGAAKKPATANLRIDGGRIVFDHPALDVLMYFTPDLARRYASTLLDLARQIDRDKRPR